MGDLGPDESYSVSTSVTLENVLPGEHYFIVRTNDLSDVFEGLATANNATATRTTIRFELPTLTLDEPFNDQFDAVGEANYYQIMASGRTDMFESRSMARMARTTELYVSRGDVPTRSE